MDMDKQKIDNMLDATHAKHGEEYSDRYLDHYLDQYRIYLHIFNSTSDHRHKSNEFFLGLNTAIMGIMGYIETKEIAHAPIIFILVPLVGIAICACWYRLILSFTQLNRAKFKVIHEMERKLPVALFETEWQILGKGKDPRKYRPLSHIEKYIPVIFIVLYIIIFLVNSPMLKIFQ